MSAPQTFTYNLASPVGTVRLIIGDTLPDKALLWDEEVTALLALYSQDVRLAAAAALERMATDQALLMKKFELTDYSADGPKLADSLRAHAKQLRTEATEGLLDADAVAGQFDWAEMVYEPFGYRERVANEWRRGG